MLVEATAARQHNLAIGPVLLPGQTRAPSSHDGVRTPSQCVLSCRHGSGEVELDENMMCAVEYRLNKRMIVEAALQSVQSEYAAC